MTALPSLYISHGSPMTALHPGQTRDRLIEVAASLPKPRAIVIATAHWLARTPHVGADPKPQTIHDFSGFPQALYEMQYPAPGDPVLAAQVAERLTAHQLPATLDPTRGLDHGVWAVLHLMYPAADIPLVPVSIQPYLGPGHHLAMGRALADLRHDNVLIIGSGSITHNLRDWRGRSDGVADYVPPFVDWMENKLRDNQIDALLDYRKQAPFAEKAHPSDEHLLPLYFAMGAAGSATLGAQRIDAGIDIGFLAMDIYRFDGEQVSATSQTPVTA